MKRFLCLVLCIILTFSLFACSKPEQKPDEPINGRWLYRAHAFIQVLTITDSNIERQYMTFEPENIDYKINSTTVDNETHTYALSVTEGGFTYDTEIVVTGDTLVWEGMEYRRLADDEEVDFTFTEEEIQDILFSENEMVQVNPETGKPIEEDTAKEESVPEVKVENDKPVEKTSASSDDLLAGKWRHENEHYTLEFEFADGVKSEYYNEEYSMQTTYKILSVTPRDDGSTLVVIEETDETLVLPINITLRNNTLNYGEDEFIFTKIK